MFTGEVPPYAGATRIALVPSAAHEVAAPHPPPKQTTGTFGFVASTVSSRYVPNTVTEVPAIPLDGEMLVTAGTRYVKHCEPTHAAGGNAGHMLLNPRFAACTHAVAMVNGPLGARVVKGDAHPNPPAVYEVGVGDQK